MVLTVSIRWLILGAVLLVARDAVGDFPGRGAAHGSGPSLSEHHLGSGAQNVGILIRDAIGPAGGSATVAVGLMAGTAVSATENEIGFGPQARIAFNSGGEPDCQVNSAIGKHGYFGFKPTGCTPGSDCTGIKAFVIGVFESTQFECEQDPDKCYNLDPIPDGSTLYICRLNLGTAGMYPLTCAKPKASDPEGAAVDTTCSEGTVVVVGTPAATFSVTPTRTHTPTPSRTSTPVPTLTPTTTPTHTATRTSTTTQTRTLTRTVTHTPTPTWSHTPTVTHTSTVTYTPTRTPTHTSTPTITPTPRIVEISIDPAVGAPGEIIDLVVSISTSGESVAATANEISFPTGVFTIEPVDCRINPSIRKSLVASVIAVNDFRTTLRLFVQATSDLSPIPDGVLYRCRLQIAPFALPATYSVFNVNAAAFQPTGEELGYVVSADGEVRVSLVPIARTNTPTRTPTASPTQSQTRTTTRTAAPTTRPTQTPGGRDPCVGDCDGDGQVLINEVIAGVNVGLELLGIEACVAADGNGDGRVAINEVIAAVNNGLTECPGGGVGSREAGSLREQRGDYT